MLKYIGKLREDDNVRENGVVENVIGKESNWGK